MSILIWEFHDLIFDRWAVSRSCSFNHTGIKRRSVQICPNNLMSFFIGISQPAGFLLNLYIFFLICKTEWNNSLVSKLFCHLRKINRILINSGWCPCLKSSHGDSMTLQGICQVICCLKSIWSCMIADFSINTARL